MKTLRLFLIIAMASQFVVALIIKYYDDIQTILTDHQVVVGLILIMSSFFGCISFAKYLTRTGQI
jgi:hypothetical protein